MTNIIVIVVGGLIFPSIILVCAHLGCFSIVCGLGGFTCPAGIVALLCLDLFPAYMCMYMCTELPVVKAPA